VSSVGWVTDPRYLDHAHPGHPERPERLTAIFDALDETGLRRDLIAIEPVPVDPPLLARVHSATQIAAARRLAESGGGYLDPDTYVGPDSYEIALLAAGGATRAVDAVLDGEVARVFAAVRPPGHHATPVRSMGFCIFNNVAIAAVRALDRDVERLMILDWDVHHGNGTQEIFYQDPRVLFCSLHQHRLYPGTGAACETGRGEGAGTTVNVPLPAGAGDDAFLRVFDDVIEPVARRFDPRLLLISAGYDAHHRDPIAGLRVSVDGFGRLATRAAALADAFCDGRVVACLEGGYDRRALGWSVAATVTALLGRRLPSDPLGPSRAADIGIDDLLSSVRRIHCL
jgi:acetoin utilization deacetylase AcuC-like enzyme